MNKKHTLIASVALAIALPPAVFALRGRRYWSAAYLLSLWLLMLLNRAAVEWLSDGWPADYSLVQMIGLPLLLAFLAPIHLAWQYRNRNADNSIHRWQGAAFVALLTLASPLLLQRFHSEIYQVQSLSMAPSLKKGDLVLVEKFSALNRWLGNTQIEQLQAADLVLFQHQQHGRHYLKRIIALPGEQLRIRQSLVSIDKHAVSRELVRRNRRSDVYRERLNDSDYPILLRTDHKRRDDIDIIIPPDHYFLLGDSRDNSIDSRHFGPVARSALIGVVR